jgi:hypothetical protein
MKNYPLFFSLFALFVSTSLCGQTKDSTLVGTVSGSVKDTALHSFLQAASVTINKASDGSLVAYSMTNSRGEFSLGRLPTGQLLQLSVSYIGYVTRMQKFLLQKVHPAAVIGEVDLIKITDATEDSVVVTPPPVRMNGDTLEFSAAAFALDKNAVAEDLLKKLPGVIVWGDGTITVNGKQISKLLVDGKPFFGGDTKIATQNLPKNTIDKIQVYQELKDPDDPLDSITSINIKLRKGKHVGYFGSFSAGGGTDSRYELGASSSLFSPKDQIAIVGQSNNINKMANDVAASLRNNTFKGTGAQVEYQPDFSLPGRNHPSSAGFTFTHDFLPTYNNYEKNLLSANSFLTRNNNQTLRNTTTVGYIGKDSTLTQHTSDELKNTTTVEDVTLGYRKHTSENTFTINGLYHGKTSNWQDSLQNNLYGPDNRLVSGNFQYDSSNSTAHSLNFHTSFDHAANRPAGTRRLMNWNIDHAILIASGHQDSLLRSDFSSLVQPTMGRSYDRSYGNHADTINQRLSMRLGDFVPWLFGDNFRFLNFHLVAKNDAVLDIAKRDNIVKDKDAVLGSYVDNTYLTANNRYTALKESPDLNIERRVTHVLANRYSQDFSINLDLQEQFYAEKNTSTHSFQQYSNSFNHFTPAISLDYSNFQYSTFLDKYKVNADINYDYPTTDQRVPLVDSSNFYSIREGNPFLRPIRKYEVAASFRHDSYRSKNTFWYGANVSGGISDHYLADSVVVDPSGRYTYHTINQDGYRYVMLMLSLNKAFVYQSHQFQLSIGSISNDSRTPGYLEVETGKASHTLTNIFMNSDTASILYTYKDWVAINFIENLSLFRSTERGLDNSSFSNTQTSSKLGIGIHPTKRFYINSNVAYIHSATSGTAAYRYTIWNASMAYRFLPGNNLELKASALDLLNENKGILNYGNSLSYTHGTVNMLRQYFLMTLTFFPRKFGRN